jgi:hypothetical protein
MASSIPGVPVRTAGIANHTVSRRRRRTHDQCGGEPGRPGRPGGVAAHAFVRVAQGASSRALTARSDRPAGRRSSTVWAVSAAPARGQAPRGPAAHQLMQDGCTLPRPR